MFVAVLPSAEALEHLADFLEPRQEAGPDLRWTVSEQWHVTLAFMPAVAPRHLDDLEDRLARAASRRTTCGLRLAGGGAFPDVATAKVLFAQVEGVPAAGPAAGPADAAEGPGGDLERLSAAARTAASTAGAEVKGGRFHPHVTLARSGRPIEATRWVRVLDAYEGPAWTAQELVLVASHLGEGPRRRPRHEVVGAWPLGG